MTVREWKNAGWGIFSLSVFATIVNLLGLKGVAFNLSILIGVAILSIFTHRVIHSKDRRIVTDYIEKRKEQTSDVFSTEKYLLAKETSDKKLTEISSLVLENYSKVDIDKLLETVENWKQENNFNWDTSTLYDEILIEGEVKKGKLIYNIKHDKYTKHLKIRGKLEEKLCNGYKTEVAKDDEEIESKGKGKVKAKDGSRLYTIHDLVFNLKNVYQRDLDVSAIWEISLNTQEKGYSGIIVGKEVI